MDKVARSNVADRTALFRRTEASIRSDMGFSGPSGPQTLELGDYDIAFREGCNNAEFPAHG